MKLPDHLRANGFGFAAEGASVAFAAAENPPEIRIILRDHYGIHDEPVTNPETAHWIAQVLSAAVKWGNSRSNPSAEAKARASRELLKILGGEAGTGRLETPGQGENPSPGD